MAIGENTAVIQSVRGRIGGQAFSVQNGRQAIRASGAGRTRSTNEQRLVRQKLAWMSSVWKELTVAERDAWGRVAADVNQKMGFSAGRKYTPFSIYMSYQMGCIFSTPGSPLGPPDVHEFNLAIAPICMWSAGSLYLIGTTTFLKEFEALSLEVTKERPATVRTMKRVLYANGYTIGSINSVQGRGGAVRMSGSPNEAIAAGLDGSVADFSVGVWFKPNIQGTGVIRTVLGGPDWALLYQDSAPYTVFFSDAFGNASQVVGVGDSWNHAVCNYDQSTGKIRLYLNDGDEGSEVSATIGGRPTEISLNFQNGMGYEYGDIDLCRVRLRTDLMTQPGMEAQWSFGEGKPWVVEAEDYAGWVGVPSYGRNLWVAIDGTPNMEGFTDFEGVLGVAPELLYDAGDLRLEQPQVSVITRRMSPERIPSYPTVSNYIRE